MDRQKELDNLENNINQIKNHEEYKSLNIGPRINAEQQKRFKYYTTLLSSYEKKKEVLLQDYTSVPAALADKIEQAKLPGNYIISKNVHHKLGNIHIKKEVLEEAKAKKPVQKMYMQRQLEENARKRVELAQAKVNRMDRARPTAMAAANPNTDTTQSTQGVATGRLLIRDNKKIINPPEVKKPMMIRNNVGAPNPAQQQAVAVPKTLSLKTTAVQGVSTPKNKKPIIKPIVKPVVEPVEPVVQEIKEDNLELEQETLDDLI